MAKAVGVLILTILIMSVYSVSITMIVGTIPSDTLVYVDAFSSPSEDFEFTNLTTNTEEAQSNIRSRIPQVDIGSLTFYSGNFFVDFIGNFLTSIPQMLTLIFSSMRLFGINISSLLLVQVQALISVLVGTLFTIFIIVILVDIRSGRQIS